MTEDAAHGTLLGLVVGERLNGAVPAGELGLVAGNALAIGELLAVEDDPHEGELARSLAERGTGDPRYGGDLTRLFACWETGAPVALAAFDMADGDTAGGTDLRPPC